MTLDEGSTVTGNTVTLYHATNGGGIYNACGFRAWLGGCTVLLAWSRLSWA